MFRAEPAGLALGVSLPDHRALHGAEKHARIQTQLNLVLPDAVDVRSALRFTLSILLGQLFVKVHLAGLEFVNPLQSSRREPASSESCRHRRRRQAGRGRDPPAARPGQEGRSRTVKWRAGKRNDAVIRNVSMSLELAAGLPRVRGDRVQLQQVVLNLMLNGLEATREPGAPARSARPRAP
jgi:signal transduction histidine kinase